MLCFNYIVNLCVQIKRSTTNYHEALKKKKLLVPTDFTMTIFHIIIIIIIIQIELFYLLVWTF